MTPAAAADGPDQAPPLDGEPTAAAAGPINRSFAAHWMGACHVYPRCPWCDHERRAATPTDEALERAARYVLKLVAFTARGPAGSPAVADALERNRDELARALVAYARAGCR